MNTFKSRLKIKRNSATGTITKLLSTATLVILTGLSNVNAGPLDLVDIPLFLQGSAPPAIAVSFDTTPDTRNAYVFFNETLGTATNVPGKKKLLASPDINIIYYNPENEYPPPLFEDGTLFPEYPFTSACRDGYKAVLEPGYSECGVDLSAAFNPILHDQSNGGYNETNGPLSPAHAFYNRYIGPRLRHLTDPSLDRPNYADITDNANYVKVLIGNPDPDLTVVPVANQKQNFSNWFSYYITRNRLVRSSATRAFGVMDDGFKINWQTFKVPFLPNNMFPMRGAHRVAFWDWLLTLEVQGASKLDEAMKNAGELFQQDQTYMEDGVGDLLSCQQNFHVLLVNERSVGNYPTGSGVQIVANETDINLLGDGINSFDSNDPEAAIYYDPEVKTIADSAFTYWAKDLMPGLDNDVPKYLSSFKNANGIEQSLGAGQDSWDTTTTTGNALFWNDKNDPANWQHMVNFIVGLGMRGYLQPDETKHDSRNGPFTDYQKLRKGTIPWGPASPTGQEVPIKYTDSLWHAAVNSRGEFVAASSPQELTDAFLELINHLFTRRTGSSSASTVSANIVTEDTKLYKTGFDALDWSGTVVAQRINLDGSVGDPIWDAACKLTGGPCGTLGGTVVAATRNHTNRRIFSYDKSTGETRAFKKTSLTTNQATALNQSVLIQNGTADLEQLVNYLRGERDNEEKNGGVFRSRRVLLGDVIHSAARVVRGPSESYIDDAFPNDANIVTDGDGHSYTDFKVDNADRQNILLVGANDGMLHAFDAENGDELWAYIPSQSLANMHLLADPFYGHQNFVDSTPSIRDIYINGEWKTVAVGGLRLGGQGYYALDITDPLSPEVMWEFTDADNDEMGYSYGKPFITRLKDDKWVALLPNGYNSIIPDGHVGSGISALFMVDMVDGSLIKSFTTTNGDVTQTNGMASAAVSDVPYDITGDAIFVGDLRGDVYRIDLTDSSYPMELMINSIDPYKTHITTPLKLTQYQNFSNSPNDVLVHIGTGKFIENSDRSSASIDPQYIAGIFDRGVGDAEYPINIVSDPRIVEQTVETQNDTTGERTISGLPVTKGAHLGWRMLLPDTGERFISKMISRASAHFLIYSSYLPKGGSACSTGGASWIMVVDNRTGGQPISGSILNGGTADGLFVEDQIFIGPPIGFAGGGGEVINITLDGNDSEEFIILIPDFTWRRRSWHRMFQDN